MAEKTQSVRPLSPHIGIYRPQLNSVTSILNRITGNALIVSFALVAWWLFAAASGPDYFAVANGFLTSWFGQLILIISLWGIWYHYLAGMRHLFFDAGHGHDPVMADKLGWGMVIGSVVLTLLTIVIV